MTKDEIVVGKKPKYSTAESLLFTERVLQDEDVRRMVRTKSGRDKLLRYVGEVFSDLCRDYFSEQWNEFADVARSRADVAVLDALNQLNLDEMVAETVKARVQEYVEEIVREHLILDVNAVALLAHTEDEAARIQGVIDERRERTSTEIAEIDRNDAEASDES